MMTLSVGLPIGSLDAYVQSVTQIAPLSSQEERVLAKAWHETQDLNAAKKLVMSNLRYVVNIAKGYLGYGLPLADLIQEGNIGLMKAVKKFDPDVGVKLISFAVHWIKAEIHEFILRNWRIVKIATTKSQRRLFFKLKSFKQKFGENLDVIAKEMGIKKNTVELMDARLNSYDADIADFHDMPAEVYSDPAKLMENQDNIKRKENLLYALSQLDARSKDILMQRYLSDDKPTLQSLAKNYNVSFQRICQIEKSAMQKLRLALSNLDA